MKLQSELIIISDYFNFVRMLKEINELGSRLEEVENAIVEMSQVLKEFGVDSKCFIGADTTKLKNDLEIFEPNSEIEDIYIEEIESIKTNSYDPWTMDWDKEPIILAEDYNFYEEFGIY